MNCHMTAGILGRAEVKAVGDGERPGTGYGHVPVRLGERQLRPRVRVKLAVPAVAVGGEGDAKPGRLIDPQQAGVMRHGEDGVAADIAVVLLGHPGLVTAVRRAEQQAAGRRAARRRTRVASRGPGQPGRIVGDELILALGAPRRPVVEGALGGGAGRRNVDDLITVPGHLEPTRVSHLADHRRLHVPFGADGHERADVLRRDDRHHAFL